MNQEELESSTVGNRTVEATHVATLIQQSNSDIDERVSQLEESASIPPVVSSGSIFSASQEIIQNPDIVINQSDAVMKFYRLVRDFVLRIHPWSEAVRYHTKPDERYDMTLVSNRVYGRRDEFIVVQASADLDSTEQMLEEQLLVLPTEGQLMVMKSRAGYVNLDQMRHA